MNNNFLDKKDSEEDKHSLDVLLELKRFVVWRNNNIRAYNDFYESLGHSRISKYKIDKEVLIFFRKCMIQLTRQMCKCRKKCMNRSFGDILFLNERLIEDRSYIFVDEYTDCKVYGTRILNGKMYEEKDKLPDKKIKARLKSTMKNLCSGDFFSYNDLKCLYYEINDICKNDEICVKKYSIRKLPNNCILENHLNIFQISRDVIKGSVIDILEGIKYKMYEEEIKMKKKEAEENLLIVAEKTTEPPKIIEEITEIPNYSNILKKKIPIDYSRGDIIFANYGKNTSSNVIIYISDVSKDNLPFDVSRAERFTNDDSEIFFESDSTIHIFGTIFIFVVLDILCMFVLENYVIQKNEGKKIYNY